MECAYCVVVVLICLDVILVFVIGSFNLVSKLCIVGMRVVALVPATKIMSGATVHPFVAMLSMSG